MAPQWMIPGSKSIMLSSMLTAVLIAIGHHLFYQHLMGQELPDSIYVTWGDSIKLAEQQLNFAAGTLLALLVKAFIGIAVSTAHEQHVWKVIRSQPTAIATIDGLFLAKSNILDLFDLRLWRRGTLSMLLALVFWILPVAFLVPPASLTIHQIASPDTHLQRVPRIDFKSTNFASIDIASIPSPENSGHNSSEEEVSPMTRFTTEYNYAGPQDEVQRVVLASLTASQVLPIPPPHPNSTWTLNFHAPALSCDQVSGTLYQEIWENIFDATFAESPSEFGYFSWVAVSQSNNGSLPFQYISDDASYHLHSYQTNPTIQQLFFALLPIVGSIEIAQCSLCNATYTVDFNYVNGIQDIRPVVSITHNNLTLPGTTGPNPFLAMFPNGSAVPFLENAIPSSYNTSLMEAYSFAAIMESFAHAFVGTISRYATVFGNTSQVISTALLRTKQFNSLNAALHGQTSSFQGLEPRDWNGLSVTQAGNFTADWLDTIERLFQNATISLMGSEVLRPNYSSPYAPPDTLVTITTIKNVYNYSNSIFGGSYGAALGIALLAIAVALFSVGNGASYSTKFSTILRVAHILSFSSPLEDEDVSGKDPTPDRVGKITVTFPHTILDKSD
ncbi:hypothetical protein F5Y08DRAFT_353440 [Xylaria arbuscula]|nr:hypothetical protein F5Y08DRAFT_353440 [Xylaria arbuscula]